MQTLSVIVPCYNVERYVAGTVASLARNSGPGVEFVLVDDASTDDTFALLSEAALRLPNATVLRRESNGGLSAARNSGLARATGRYLTFLDGDDAVAPGYFAALVQTIDTLGCDFVRTDHVQVQGRTRTLYRVVHAPRGVVCPPSTGIGLPGRRSAVDSPYAWAGIYHRRLLDDGMLTFDPALRTCEDRPWIWRLHLQAGSFAVSGLRGVRYRRDVAGSLTQVCDERQLDFIPAFERVIGLVLAQPEPAWHLPKALRTYCAVTCHHLGRADLFAPHLREELRRRSAQSLAGLPAAELAATIASLDEDRRRTLLDVLNQPATRIAA